MNLVTTNNLIDLEHIIECFFFYLECPTIRIIYVAIGHGNTMATVVVIRTVHSQKQAVMLANIITDELNCKSREWGVSPTRPQWCWITPLSWFL